MCPMRDLAAAYIKTSYGLLTFNSMRTYAGKRGLGHSRLLKFFKEIKHSGRPHHVLRQGFFNQYSVETAITRT